IPFKKKLIRQPTVCDKVDAAWLASDRIYWDGWMDKAMFIKTDGTFTKGHVYIEQGQHVCIVVLLGPTPAKASIKDEQHDHIGPSDSITMFAEGEHSKRTIQLEQHPEQTNVYMAAVQFNQPDTYTLDTTTEYRHFFWESPIHHAYHPFQYASQNKLVVSPVNMTEILPLCKHHTLTGTWVDLDIYAASDAQALYTMYENTENEHSVYNKVFIPDQCRFEYKSSGHAARCLGKQTVHVWGDNNLRRNLKALDSQWCGSDTQDRCVCDDDHEPPTPWMMGKPLLIQNSWDIDSKIYYYPVHGPLTYQHETLLDRMAQYKDSVADIVILGFGNDDIEALQVTPKQFATTLTTFLDRVRRIYPHQRIVLRTPQYFIGSQGTWNTGRSYAFTLAVRHAVIGHDILLWDTHHLGTDETLCPSIYSKRHVVNIENQMLWHLLC
ncbi:hypothetical protein CU098_004498, partial [Rhizopus stolonifer]